MKHQPAKPREAAMTMQDRDPFGLASLPELTPPGDGWSVVAAQLERHNRRRQFWLAGLAIAASVTLVLGVVTLLPQPAEMPLNSGQNVAIASMAGSDKLPAETGTSPEMAAGPDNLQSLQKLSLRLEKNLAYLREGVGPMSAEMVVYQVELEDLVAQVDAAISQRPESSELWRQRVNLLMDLNQIYGAGLRRDEPYVASL
jgi:hypothetical protein